MFVLCPWLLVTCVAFPLVVMSGADFGSDVRILLPIERSSFKQSHGPPKKRKMPSWLQKELDYLTYHCTLCPSLNYFANLFVLKYVYFGRFTQFISRCPDIILVSCHYLMSHHLIRY